MFSLKAEKFSKFIKQCKTKSSKFYILRGKMFNHILTNEVIKNELELQDEYIIREKQTENFDYLSDCLQKDINFLTGRVYWIYENSSFGKVYRLKDFNVMNISYEMVLVKLFFHFGIAYSLVKNKSVKHHFIYLELLKQCLVIAEGLKSTKTLQNIEAIAFSCFLSQVVNVFKITSKANIRPVKKDFVELKEKFSLSFFPSNVSHSQLNLSNLQVYLSFLDGYAYRIISFTENFKQYQISFSSAYLATTTYIKDLVMFYDLQLFVQSANEKKFYVFRQTYCSKEVYSLCETEFSKHVIDSENSLITTLTTALVCFDWLIELVCSCIFASDSTNELNEIVVIGLYLNKSLYKKLQLDNFLHKIDESLLEKHREFFQSSVNTYFQKKRFLLSVLESSILNCFKSHNRFFAISERLKIIIILLCILKKFVIICL